MKDNTRTTTSFEAAAIRIDLGCDLKVLKRSAGGIATRRARPIRFVVDPRPLA